MSEALQRAYGPDKKAEADREAKRVKDTKPSHPLDAYAGTYGHPAWGNVTVAMENDKLVFHLGTSPENAGILEHWNYDVFRMRMGDGRGGWTYLGFSAGLDGSIGNVALGSPSLTFARVCSPQTR